LPKFISPALAMLIGVTILADPLAVALTCAKVLMEIPMSNIAMAKILICVFIVFVFLRLLICLFLIA